MTPLPPRCSNSIGPRPPQRRYSYDSDEYGHTTSRRRPAMSARGNARRTARYAAAPAAPRSRPPRRRRAARALAQRRVPRRRRRIAACAKAARHAAATAAARRLGDESSRSSQQGQRRTGRARRPARPRARGSGAGAAATQSFDGGDRLKVLEAPTSRARARDDRRRRRRRRRRCQLGLALLQSSICETLSRLALAVNYGEHRVPATTPAGGPGALLAHARALARARARGRVREGPRRGGRRDRGAPAVPHRVRQRGVGEPVRLRVGRGARRGMPILQGPLTGRASARRSHHVETTGGPA